MISALAKIRIIPRYSIAVFKGALEITQLAKMFGSVNNTVNPGKVRLTTRVIDTIAAEYKTVTMTETYLMHLVLVHGL